MSELIQMPLRMLHRFARTRWLPGDWALACVLSFTWLTVYNSTFWQHAFQAMYEPALSRIWFLASLALLVLYLQAAALLLLPSRNALRIGASLLFVIAALAGHFIDTFGIVVNRDMLRNVMQTDAAETRDLLAPMLWIRLVVLGVLPAVLLWRVRLPPQSLGGALRQRAIFLAAGLVVVVLFALPASASYAVFLREFKPVRSQLNPGAAVSAAIGFASELATPAPPAPLDPGGTPWRVDANRVLTTTASRRPRILFLVIGETARAANFQLNGYGRPTNPALAAMTDVAYFPDAASCGTSTAASVPCLFSHRGRADFRPGHAKAETNLLDMLARAGVAVEWRDNNSGCKGVCERVTTLDYFAHRGAALDAAGADAGASALCDASHCFDEVMNLGLGPHLRHIDRDTVIVFHQVGSHGPAYFERYPGDDEVFRPACRSSRLDTCTPEQIVNAYDNTIRYTDRVVAAQIELLRSLNDQADTALIYVSDHGESLGEQGVYLHGLPYNFAPRVQREVPLLVWLSASFQRDAGVTTLCLKTKRQPGARSHDEIFHTVFGLMGVRNAVYREERDLTATCREGYRIGSASYTRDATRSS